MYPELVGRLYWQTAIQARLRSSILVKLFKELEIPPVLLAGHDICNNAGPMCSLEFLRKYYFPQEKYSLEPLVEAGIHVVRHCDGNIMPMLDDLFEVGYSGFQGFQYECGVDPYAIAGRKTATRETPIFFAGMNVTRTLPYGTPEDVREELEYVLDYTDGGNGLFFFSSSSICHDIPAENVRCAYEYAATIPCPSPRTQPKRREWPWLSKEGT
jgi:uroporphyrinogen decarboxylase